MVGGLFAVTQALGAAGRIASGVMSAEARQAEFSEQLRNLQLKKDYTIGLAKARAGASGVEIGSMSTQSYLSRLTDQFDRQTRLLKQAKRATLVSDIVGMIGGGLESGANMYATLGRMNNWGGSGASTPAPYNDANDW